LRCRVRVVELDAIVDGAWTRLPSETVVVHGELSLPLSVALGARNEPSGPNLRRVVRGA